MVAVLTPTTASPSPALGAAGAPFPRRPVPTGRPALRVIEGGRAPHRTAPGVTPHAVYLRRRIVAALVGVLLLGALVVGVRAAVSLLAAPVTPTAPAAAAAPIVADTYVVRPGDTLWSIAERLDPGADPRPLVDVLRSRAGGVQLEAGQRLDVSGLGA